MSQANIDEDNERADRNVDSLIQDRNVRRGEARRYHDVQAGNVRRGQDIRWGDTRRGQDLRSSDGGRGGGAAAAPRGPVPAKSRAEAMKLPPGTEVQTPDGAVLRVPKRWSNARGRTCGRGIRSPSKSGKARPMPLPPMKRSTAARWRAQRSAGRLGAMIERDRLARMGAKVRGLEG